MELGDSDSLVEIRNLQPPVVITNNQVDEKQSINTIDRFRSELTKLECVFWDAPMSEWSRDGICLVPVINAKCESNHLTNFAVLVVSTS